MPIQRRHSKICPCNEHIQTQAQYYSDLTHKLIRQESPKSRKAILRKTDPCFIRYISRCAKGVLTGDVPLQNKKEYKNLNKTLLTKLATPHKSIDNKRNILIKQSEQTGGFLGILAEIAAAAIASLIGARLAKR